MVATAESITTSNAAFSTLRTPHALCSEVLGGVTKTPETDKFLVGRALHDSQGVCAGVETGTEEEGEAWHCIRVGYGQQWRQMLGQIQGGFVWVSLAPCITRAPDHDSPLHAAWATRMARLSVRVRNIQGAPEQYAAWLCCRTRVT